MVKTLTTSDLTNNTKRKQERLAREKELEARSPALALAKRIMGWGEGHTSIPDSDLLDSENILKIKRRGGPVFNNDPARPLIDMVQATMSRPLQFYGWQNDNAEKADMKALDRIGHDYRIKLNRTKVFRLSPDFARLVQAVSYEHPQRIWNAITAARLPYDFVWMEWDQQSRIEARRETQPGSPPVADSTAKSGAMLSKLRGSDTAFGMDMFTVWDDPVGDLLWYWPNRGVWDTDEPVPVTWVRDSTGQFVIGSRNATMQEDQVIGASWYRYWAEGPYADERGRKLLPRIRQHTGMSMNPIFAATIAPMLRNEGGVDTEAPGRLMASSVEECAGDLRFVITALALLQEKWVAKEPSREKAGHRMAGGRLLKYLDHHTLTVVAPKERRIHLATRALTNAGRRRRHEVHGHWCYRINLGRDDCAHVWVKTDEHRQKQVCNLCAAERWWRKAHERGDATVGFARKDYRVIAPSEMKD